MDRLKNKVAIITGGGAGIGRATCELFAEQGAIVVIAERDEANGREVAQAIVAKGGRALFIQTDVGNEASIKAMASATDKEFGRIDILVNNAAVFVLKGIDATVEEWRQILDVNVIGLALCSKHCVPIMKRGGGGSIVNLASISSVIAQPEMVTYNATKAAVANMTRCMAMDLANDNIRVNAVGPGTIWTQIVQRRTAELGMDRKAADADPDWGGSHFIKRIAEPREIAYPILFLASDEASFVTGSLLMADGGYTAR